MALALSLLSVLLVAGARQTQTPGSAGDLVLRVGGPVAIDTGEVASNVAVINNNATVDGHVREGLIVINGNAMVRGTVGGSVICANGRVELAPTARVSRDVVLYRCTLDRQSGALVGGKVVEQTSVGFGRKALLFFWAGITMVTLVGALIFAGLGGGILERAVVVIRDRPGEAAGFGLITWVAVPIIAGLSFITVVAAPLGLALLFVVGPAAWFLGYLVAGTFLGRLLARAMGFADQPGRPYGAAAFGAIALQLISILPFLGAVAMLLAGALGTGALARLAWVHWTRRAPTPVTGQPNVAPAR